MSLIISLKVVPSSHKSELVLDKSGKLRAYLKSPPEEGRANSELIKLFARSLGCPQSAVTLVAGATSRTKKLHLDVGLSFDEMLATLGCAVQIKLPHP
jgi:hypothetical protein